MHAMPLIVTWVIEPVVRCVVGTALVALAGYAAVAGGRAAGGRLRRGSRRRRKECES